MIHEPPGVTKAFITMLMLAGFMMINGNSIINKL